MKFCSNCIYKQVIGESLTYPANHLLFRDIDKADYVYRIQSGYIKIYKYSDNGDERIIGLLGPGDYVGLLVVLQNKFEYIANAITITAVSAKKMRTMDVINEYQRNTLFKESCLNCAITRSNLFQTHLVQSMSANTEERILNILKGLYQRFGYQFKEEYIVELPFSKIDLANLIGIQRETLSRHLAQMQSKKIIRVEKNKYYLEYVI